MRQLAILVVYLERVGFPTSSNDFIAQTKLGKDLGCLCVEVHGRLYKGKTTMFDPVCTRYEWMVLKGTTDLVIAHDNLIPRRLPLRGLKNERKEEIRLTKWIADFGTLKDSIGDARPFKNNCQHKAA